MAIVKSVIIFSAAFGKMRGVFFFAARIVDIIEDIVLSDMLSCNSSQMSQLYIPVGKFPLQRPNIFNIFKNTGGEETGSRTLGIQYLYIRILLSS